MARIYNQFAKICVAIAPLLSERHVSRRLANMNRESAAVVYNSGKLTKYAAGVFSRPNQGMMRICQQTLYGWMLAQGRTARFRARGPAYFARVAACVSMLKLIRGSTIHPSGAGQRSKPPQNNYLRTTHHAPRRALLKTL